MTDNHTHQADKEVEDQSRLPAAELARLRAEYAPAVVDHWLNPRNLGRLEPAAGHSGGPGPCGDSMWIWLRVAEKDSREIITRATFLSDICIGAVSCGSMLTALITGMEVRQAMQLTADDLREALGGLPEREYHCADLAIRTLRQTILDYHQRKAAGWKNLYRRPS